MEGDHGDDYLAGLPAEQAAELARVNGPGLAALREYLDSGAAVAFLGAGVSAPLYPLWNGLISELVDAAAGRLAEREAETCRALAQDSPEEAVEIVRERLGAASYREVLRDVLRARVDPESGRSWTPVQELVCRCTFKAVVTTNYDPGIVDARIRVRPGALSTGFTTWEDELGLDQWRTGDVFGEAELPVLFAHGQHNRPDSVVLATTEYRRAYAGKLPQVLARLMDGHLVWLGFSFADQRIAAILREIADQTGTRIDPGAAPRHVAVMAWDPDAAGNDPGVLARRAEIAYGAQVVLYPARGGDHSALGRLLATLTNPRYPSADEAAARGGAPHHSGALATAPGLVADGGADDIPVAWVPATEPVPHFTGRTEELARLDRWAADPQVSLIGVTAWGGAGKTALVNHWVRETGGASHRPGIRGVFGWSFYSDPSAEHWAMALLDWARQDLGLVATKIGRPAAAVLTLLRTVPLLLVLDGLEVAQEGPAGGDFGRLLDGTLREVLVGACQVSHGGLVVLTSRFPFADLEAFDGATARMVEVPPFTPAEGAVLLGATGGDWLPERERRSLVAAVDGHALAVSVLAGLLDAHLPATDLAALLTELGSAARTDARVGKVLRFYADWLAEPDRYLLAAVCLFARPVGADAVLTLVKHEAFGNRLAGWNAATVEAAVRDRLGGLAAWHPDSTISAHPLVRDTFRPLALQAAQTAADTALAALPAGKVTTRADALRVVETIELLLDAGHWKPADDIYTNRCDSGRVFQHLPAARLGERAATAFVADPARRTACAAHLSAFDLGFYLNEVGLFAMLTGDVASAVEYLPAAIRQMREAGDQANLAASLRNLAECLGLLGRADPAQTAVVEALTYAQTMSDKQETCFAQAYLGWLADLTGDTTQAEQQFTAADQIEVSEHHEGAHLYSSRGTWWADWLSRTGRPIPARALTDRNTQISARNGWNQDVALCDRILGRLALIAGDTAAAVARLAAAADSFRDGDFLTELADTLPDLADCALATGNTGAADLNATEAITIAAPRGLAPAHCAGLAARARVRAVQTTAAGADPSLLFQGRDAADAALRLAARHHLPWRELGALRAHAALDQAEGIDRGWTAKAGALHARLVPPGLDPDPLATVERLVAEQRAPEAGRDGAGGQ